MLRLSERAEWSPMALTCQDGDSVDGGGDNNRAKQIRKQGMLERVVRMALVLKSRVRYLEGHANSKARRQNRRRPVDRLR